MVYAQRVHRPGGADAMVWEQIDVGAPAAGQVRLRQTAIGVNFVDVYFRTGLYPPPEGYPFIPGKEAVGVVDAVGAGVTHVRVGDRVAYVGPLGAYAEARLIDAQSLVPVPDFLTDSQAVALMLKGMTAYYLLHQTFPVKAGDTLLIHAAAGGVGLIVCQWASRMGVTVIGTVGSVEKAALAQANGCHHTILYREENVAERVRTITHGALCDVVYDSVGQAMYPHSLDCLRPKGMWVSFGQSSGMIEQFTLKDLAKRGSLFATRPSLFDYIVTRTELENTARAVFEVARQGIVNVRIADELPLKEAGKAHQLLEGRQTTGALVMRV